MSLKENLENSRRDVIGEYFKSQNSKADAGKDYRPRRSFNPKDNMMSSVRIGIDGEIEANVVDKYGNSIYKDKFGNAKLQAQEDTEAGINPDLSYQTKYDIKTIETASGIKKAFVSSKDDNFIGGLEQRLASISADKEDIKYLESGEKQVENMTEEEMDSNFNLKYGSTKNLAVGKLRKVGDKETSQRIDREIRYRHAYEEYMSIRPEIDEKGKVLKQEKMIPIVKAENAFSVDTSQEKKGIRITCMKCDCDKISLDMNFCPNCGEKFR